MSSTMSKQTLVQELADLLMQTGHGHHEAFIDTDGFDPDWPLWYAEQLHPKLGPLLNAKFSKSELIYLLVLLSKEQPLYAPGADWTVYYSKVLIERYL
jgi:hypothetical protein